MIQKASHEVLELEDDVFRETSWKDMLDAENANTDECTNLGGMYVIVTDLDVFVSCVLLNSKCTNPCSVCL